MVRKSAGLKGVQTITPNSKEIQIQLEINSELSLN